MLTEDTFFRYRVYIGVPTTVEDYTKLEVLFVDIPCLIVV